MTYGLIFYAMRAHTSKERKKERKKESHYFNYFSKKAKGLGFRV